MVCGATSLVTTAPAATTAPSPTCTPSITTALAPIRTLSSTRLVQRMRAQRRLPKRYQHRYENVSTIASATKHRTHINHGLITNFSTNIDSCAHHDHGIVPNQNLIADNGTWLNSSVNSFMSNNGTAELRVWFSISVSVISA
jgi:hypothetical protein